MLAAELLGADAEAVVRRAIADAKRGKPVALRLVLERLIPRAKGETVQLDLPRIEKAADITDACGVVIAAAAAGEITLADARGFMDLLELQRAALETRDLAVRVEMLELRGSE